MKNKLVTTVTERGQVSIPAKLRRTLGLKTGMLLEWVWSGKKEVKIIVRDPVKPLDP